VLLGSSIYEFLDKELPGYRLEQGAIWEHSMNCAVTSWMIATKVGYEDLEAVFVAGLLHDVGKVVMDEFISEENDKIVDITSDETLTQAEAERAVFGMDHAEAGARIAEKWNFDDRVVEAIRYHHQPELANKEPDLTTIIHLADCLCISLGLTSDSDGFLKLIAG
jgi:putative nucleotidyltransferase with HDIG domain